MQILQEEQELLLQQLDWQELTLEAHRMTHPILCHIGLGSPKSINLINCPWEKTIFFVVGICNQHFQGTSIFMVFDLQGRASYSAMCKRLQECRNM